MSKIALKLMVNKGFGCLGKVNMLELKLRKENMITIYALSYADLESMLVSKNKGNPGEVKVS